MRRIKITWAKPGDILGYPIFRQDGAILLNTGVKLTREYIEQLKSLGVTHIYVQDDISQDIEISDPISIQTKIEALRVIADTYHRSCKGLSLDVRALRKIVDDIVDEILSSEQVLLNLRDIRSFDNYLFSHSLGVTVLSIVIGKNLNRDDKFLRDLGIGCMLHDIGKLDIPKEILDKPDRLTEEEFGIVKFHTQYGYRRILDQDGELPATSAHVAWEHHERLNGRGYPRGLIGEKIHIFSRIAGVADVYDAMTVDRIYRKAYPPNEAVEFIMGASGSLFDYEIVKAFLRSIAPYPVGDIILLNTGDIAIVIDINREFPLRPVVRVIREDGWEDIDLMSKTDISIVKSLEE